MCIEAYARARRNRLYINAAVEKKKKIDLWAVGRSWKPYT